VDELGDLHQRLKLNEYEAKNLLATFNISIPKGCVASTPEEAYEVGVKLRSPLVVKAQVRVAGRGKAGGVLFTKTLDEVKNAADQLIGTQIRGRPVRQVLVEEQIPIKRELFFGITVDRVAQCYTVLASTIGGIDIEVIASQTPEQVVKMPINSYTGFRLYHAREIAYKLGYSQRQLSSLAQIFFQVFQAGTKYDAELIELNPLIETPQGAFIAADARLIIDDNALFRHPTFQQRNKRLNEDSVQEQATAQHRLAYVKLDGNIGVIGNGAGLVMATLDTIQYYGGQPANFLDIGGGATPETMTLALNIVHSDPTVQGIFINILGGITRCDDVARGIVQARKQYGLNKPLVIRLVGTNEREGREVLESAGIPMLDSMETGARQIVELV
jgi:succinyl-CoA synthetase beta subunit